MNLADAQTMAWYHQPVPPKTLKESLDRLEHQLEAVRYALASEDIVRYQTTLEDLLATALMATKAAELDPEQALTRACRRLKAGAAQPQKVFVLYADRVEVWVGHKKQGEWPVFSEQEYEQARQLAQDLGCQWRSGEAQGAQLPLF